MPGEPWQSGDALTAERLERHREDLRRADGLPGGAGSDGWQTTDGVVYAPRPAQEFWVKLTGGGAGGAYAWLEQVPDDAGDWVDGQRSGTAADDPAVEASGNAGLAVDGSVIVRLRLLPGSRRRMFQKGACE